MVNAGGSGVLLGEKKMNRQKVGYSLKEWVFHLGLRIRYLGREAEIKIEKNSLGKILEGHEC